MSQPQPLQERVVSVLVERGPVPAKDLSYWLPGIDRGGLDCAVNALMRANKVSLILGTYDLVKREQPRAITGTIEQKPVEPPVIVTVSNSTASPELVLSMAQSAQETAAEPNNSHPWDWRALPGEAGTETPSADEEVAASLDPQTSQLFTCDRCAEPQPNGAYRHSALGKRFKVCKRCDAELRGHVTRKSQLPRRPDKVNDPAPAYVERTNVTSDISPHTPPPPQVGSPEPPATSLEHPSGPLAHGTLASSVCPDDPEALSPVGAGRTNTPSGHPPVVNPQTVNPAGMPVESMEQAGSAPTTARASMSLPTSPTSPAAGSVAAGRLPPAAAQLDPAESALLHKRAWLEQKREALLRDLTAIIERIEEIDRVRELVRKLCEEGA